MKRAGWRVVVGMATAPALLSVLAAGIPRLDDRR